MKSTSTEDNSTATQPGFTQDDVDRVRATTNDFLINTMGRTPDEAAAQTTVITANLEEDLLGP